MGSLWAHTCAIGCIVELVGWLSRSIQPPPLPQGGEEFTSTTLARIEYSEDPVAAVKSCDLAIEAIVENMDVKKELFSKLDQSAPR